MFLRENKRRTINHVKQQPSLNTVATHNQDRYNGRFIRTKYCLTRSYVSSECGAPAVSPPWSTFSRVRE